MMGAGAGGTQYGVLTSCNQGGGDKKQGLVTTTNAPVQLDTHIRVRGGGHNRNWLFCMNQLGGVGRRWGQASGPGNRGGVSVSCQRLAYRRRLEYPPKPCGAQVRGWGTGVKFPSLCRVQGTAVSLKFSGFVYSESGSGPPSAPGDWDYAHFMSGGDAGAYAVEDVGCPFNSGTGLSTANPPNGADPSCGASDPDRMRTCLGLNTQSPVGSVQLVHKYEGVKATESTGFYGAMDCTCNKAISDIPSWSTCQKSGGATGSDAVSLTNIDEGGKVATVAHGPLGCDIRVPASCTCTSGKYASDLPSPQPAAFQLLHDNYGVLLKLLAPGATFPLSLYIKKFTSQAKAQSLLITEAAFTAAGISLPQSGTPLDDHITVRPMDNGGAALSYGHGLGAGACGSMFVMQQGTQNNQATVKPSPCGGDNCWSRTTIHLQTGMRSWSGEWQDALTSADATALSYIVEGVKGGPENTGCMQPIFRSLTYTDAYNLFAVLAKDVPGLSPLPKPGGGGGGGPKGPVPADLPGLPRINLIYFEQDNMALETTLKPSMVRARELGVNALSLAFYMPTPECGDNVLSCSSPAKLDYPGCNSPTTTHDPPCSPSPPYGCSNMKEICQNSGPGCNTDLSILVNAPDGHKFVDNGKDCPLCTPPQFPCKWGTWPDGTAKTGGYFRISSAACNTCDYDALGAIVQAWHELLVDDAGKPIPGHVYIAYGGETLGGGGSPFMPSVWSLVWKDSESAKSFASNCANIHKNVMAAAIKANNGVAIPATRLGFDLDLEYTAPQHYDTQDVKNTYNELLVNTASHFGEFFNDLRTTPGLETIPVQLDNYSAGYQADSDGHFNYELMMQYGPNGTMLEKGQTGIQYYGLMVSPTQQPASQYLTWWRDAPNPNPNPGGASAGTAYGTYTSGPNKGKGGLPHGSRVVNFYNYPKLGDLPCCKVVTSSSGTGCDPGDPACADRTELFNWINKSSVNTAWWEWSPGQGGYGGGCAAVVAPRLKTGVQDMLEVCTSAGWTSTSSTSCKQTEPC